MSQVLSALGDTVGAVIDNEATGNRWLRVVRRMSSPPFVRLQSFRREMLTPSNVEQKSLYNSQPAVSFITATQRFRLEKFSLTIKNVYVSRDSVVGITICYGLDGPGIESPLKPRFSAPVHAELWVHPYSYTMGTGSFPVVKPS
jgi:hypothetical protein